MWFPPSWTLGCGGGTESGGYTHCEWGGGVKNARQNQPRTPLASKSFTRTIPSPSLAKNTGVWARTRRWATAPPEGPPQCAAARGTRHRSPRRPPPRKQWAAAPQQPPGWRCGATVAGRRSACQPPRRRWRGRGTGPRRTWPPPPSAAAGTGTCRGGRPRWYRRHRTHRPRRRHRRGWLQSRSPYRRCLLPRAGRLRPVRRSLRAAHKQDDADERGGY